MSTPEQVVQAQLNAYNAKDIDALMSTYHPEAEQYLLHGERLAQSHGQIRPRFMARFTEPDLHAHLLQRTAMGHFVVDAERVTRNFPDRIGHVDMLCIYEVRDGLIVKAGFGMGEPVLAL